MPSHHMLSHHLAAICQLTEPTQLPEKAIGDIYMVLGISKIGNQSGEFYGILRAEYCC